MRIDKFLKVSRVIKRRTVSKEACEGGRISVNGNSAKPAKDVKVGDVVTVTFGTRTVSFKVLSVEPPKSSKDVSVMYELLSEE